MGNFGEMRLMRLRNDAQTLNLIKTQLADKTFAFIPGSIYRKILIDFGATLDDLSALECGSIHRITSLDPDPAMYFRRVAIHRMLLTPDDDNSHDESHHRNSMKITEAGCKGLTQINENEIADEVEAFSRRSGTRYGSMPPLEYRRSSVPVAMAKLNAFMIPSTFHAMPNISNDSNTVINDQLLIRINKQSDMEESPSREGVHQDGCEISSVTLVGKSKITGGESRLWPLSTPAGNYNDDMFESSTGPYTKKKCLFDFPLSSNWDTIYFNDRVLKHEARPFDGERPAYRDVIVNFVRKPLSDGKDMKLENGEIISIE